MANEDVLGPRKTMIVLVIVVGCFAVLWPRILSPVLLGGREQLKPNQFDRDAGCCEVLFESEVAVLELLNEVCSSVLRADGKLTPLSAAECRKAVNETCGLDIAAFLKKSDNVGKTTKMLLDTMKTSNSSCLKEHFGVPVWSISTHLAVNSWMQQDTVKQERPPTRGVGPHPALRERGRAIAPSAGLPPPPRPEPLPPHVRVRSSPLQGYFELDIKPPPIPGMRPPLGSAGGPVQAPKSSMGFVMPIYTICIIVFFVYTLSKILFKRAGTVPYDEVTPDSQFRRRVFRDDSRSSPDKLGPNERDTIVTAISGLVAEVQQQMEAGYANNQQRQDVQDNHARPYTNGTVLHSGPVRIVASEYREPSKEKSPEPREKEPSPESTPEPKESTPEPKESTPEPKESTPEPEDPTPPPQEPVAKESSPESKELSPEPREPTPEPKDSTPESSQEEEDLSEPEESPEQDAKGKDATDKLIKLADNLEVKQNSVATLTGDFLKEEKDTLRILSTPELESRSTEEKQSTPELLEEALKEDSPTTEEEESVEREPENGSVKVVGMEVTAHAADGSAWPRAQAPPVTPMPPQRPPHEAEQVKSIYLETEIPQQSRVLVADFVDKTQGQSKHSPLVVSGKMTLSLIQDARRDTPDLDPESTMDDFTTASGVTQPAAEKEDNLSDEEIEEEIEIEEIEEEVEEEEEEEEEEEPKKTEKKK